jgi:hypothetical protein
MPMVPQSWSDEHRLALAIVAGATAVALAFAFLWIGKLIRQPFEPKGPGRFVTLEEQESEAEQALKFKDTDADGLSDYDELKIYRTSPYLADTDSDNVSDAEEIKKGADPNCPIGQDCRNSPAYIAPPARVNPEDVLGGSSAAAPILGFDQSIFEKFDAAKVRTLLKNAGMAEDQLAKISDQDLEAIYKEALQEQVPTSTVERLDQIYASSSAQ